MSEEGGGVRVNIIDIELELYRTAMGTGECDVRRLIMKNHYT